MAPARRLLARDEGRGRAISRLDRLSDSATLARDMLAGRGDEQPAYRCPPAASGPGPAAVVGRQPSPQPQQVLNQTLTRRAGGIEGWMVDGDWSLSAALGPAADIQSTAH